MNSIVELAAILFDRIDSVKIAKSPEQGWTAEINWADTTKTQIKAKKLINSSKIK